MMQLQLKLKFLPALKFHGDNPFKLMPMAVAAAPPSAFKFNRHSFFTSYAKPNSPLLRCRMSGNSDMISQLELGKAKEKRKPEKRVNGIFWILLINLGIYLADHVFQVPWIKGLYLYHSRPAWYQFITATFCHFSWNHLSSNLFFLYIFGKLVEEEEGNFALWLSYILTGAGANLVSWLILPRNAVSIGASGAVFGLFAISVLVKMSWDWRKILEVLILGQFVVEKVMEAAQASASLGGGLRGGYALQNVISSGFIWGIGDIAAQAVTHYTARRHRLQTHDGNEKKEKLNWRRVATTSLFGLGFVGNALYSLLLDQSKWYEGLDRFIRFQLKLQPNSFRFVGTKVAVDSIIFGPLDLLVFFTYMGFSLGKTASQVKEDVKRDFLPALVVEGGVWPILQVVNFRFVPVRYQLLYVNIFCLLDSCFLSWLEQQEDASWKQWFKSFMPQKEREQSGG
ncbi:Rhomboid-like protein 11, chloroplastic [Sesamum alatum]|uniref:Rhomboid-like protein 11, chloroplastic n=1 Tax=Sesamum alatum TaxID=300844 RepID=A0AAE1XYV8_9LAMI|nr:Rhomboid-like protein 11, chloroplastic [Sesamum alatum]